LSEPDRLARRDLDNVTRTEYEYDGVTGVPNPSGDFGVKQIIETKHERLSDGMVIDHRPYSWDAMQHKTSRHDLRAGGPMFFRGIRGGG